MYAVFRSGGKQYRAVIGDILRLEKIDVDEGTTVKFEDVLLIGEGVNIKVGTPMLSGSSVSAKVLRQGKSKKVAVVKFKRRQNYLRQGTHRQFFTEVEITAISGVTKKPAATDKPKSADKPAARKKATKKAVTKKAVTKKAVTKKAATKKAATRKKVAKKSAAKKKAQ